MKPYKTLLFLIIVFIVLSLLSFVFPKEGIQITPSLVLKFPDIKSIITPEESKYADISEILAQHQTEITENIEDFIEDTIKELNDSIHILPDSLKAEMSPDSLVIIDSLKTGTPKKQPGTIQQYFEYPENNKAVLYPFFNHLKNLKTSHELIRILHY